VPRTDEQLMLIETGSVNATPKILVTNEHMTSAAPYFPPLLAGTGRRRVKSSKLECGCGCGFWCNFYTPPCSSYSYSPRYSDPATVATDAIRDIKDPEHDLTLEELGVVSTSFRPDPRLCQFCSPKGFTVYGTLSLSVLCATVFVGRAGGGKQNR